MKKTVLVFGLLILALLLLFQLSKFAFISGNLKIELIIAVIAVVFFFVGISIRKRSVQHAPLPQTDIDHKKIKELEISQREYEVLLKISEGLSNKEIAEQLFLSESTIKTHVSNLLLKLNANGIVIQCLLR